ncbi:MAG: RNA polymerase subunit sigma-24, partial [Oscillospiraceae bacterium]|nr:RNA polymerase subunit sigma-24 [Oscillospiraceae bacterium]
MLSLYLSMLESEEDRGRFARLYLRYRGMMFRVARELLKSDMDAEDAVHQAFLSILNHFSKV